MRRKALERLRAHQAGALSFPTVCALLAAIEKFAAAHQNAAIVWIADGIDRGHAREFAEKLAAARRRTSTLVDEHRPIRALAGAAKSKRARSKSASCARAPRRPSKALSGRSISRASRIGEAPFDFAARRKPRRRFDLPVELRNEIARLEIADEHSAGAVSLLDERWKRRRVGIVSGETADLSLPLLSPNYYLAKRARPLRRRARGQARRRRSDRGAARRASGGDDSRRYRHRRRRGA